MAARQPTLLRPRWAGGLAPWFLVVFPVPVLVFRSVLIVRCLSSALRASLATGKSVGLDLVAPSTRPPSFGWDSRAEARQPKLRKIDSNLCSHSVLSAAPLSRGGYRPPPDTEGNGGKGRSEEGR